MIIKPNQPFDPTEEWQRARDQWQRREALLESFDEDLTRYATQHQMRLEKSGKGHTRRLTWTNSFSVECSLHISLPLEGPLFFSVGATASQDRQVDSRWANYWKHETIADQVACDELKDILETVMDRGRVKMEKWTGADLEFATWLAWPI